MLEEKLNFIKDYMISKNAADGSKYDANANVTNKNLCTLQGELFKKEIIKINRELLFNKIESLYDRDLAIEYIRQLENHEIYAHDETSLLPYCVSISMYPLLMNGLKSLGGESQAPKHLGSFCGNFINMIFAISSQFAGAVASVEWLMYMDYFARKDYGDDYLNTHQKEIEGYFQQVVYSINQPAAARNYQSVFWNISIYDEYYFNSLFGDFVFPDFTAPTWNTVSKLQEYFMTWFNNERKKEILTFPIVTAAMLIEEGKPKDDLFAKMCSKNLSEGNSFFIYLSESADSLASCCRLRNEFQDNTFSYTLGAGGVSTGSINVITVNMNRLIQDGRDLKEQIDKLHKYHHAYREIIIEFKNAGLLPVYDAGYISLDKQYSTIGINGMVEAAEYLGLEISNNEEYTKFVSENLKVIYDMNKEAKAKYGFIFNTEFVPAENLGVKNSNWDKKDQYVVKRDCYNSYFYVVEDENINHLDKFILHGKNMIQFLDGGSALHLNLEEYLTQEGFYKLICVAAKTGCNYFCTNVKITICNSCNHIDKKTLFNCSKCNSKDIDYGTRIIGYLKRVSSFSSPRQKEHDLRHYHQSK
jgi:ribonucleoside-triphosphate reductase